MRVFEVKKDGSLQHGRVMLGIQGTLNQLKALTDYLDVEFENSTVQEEADKEGEFVEYYIVSRADVQYFKQEFKIAKNKIK